MYVLYCPEQAPMGARNSSAKIWGWAVTRKKCLNASTKGPPRMRSRLALPVCPCFVEASPTVEKVVSCYRLLASLLSFRSVHSSPAVREFRAAREERCEPGHGQVCANLMSWPKTHQSYVSLADLLYYASISMVSGYMENPETPQYRQKWGVGACTGMGVCSGQYGLSVRIYD